MTGVDQLAERYRCVEAVDTHVFQRRARVLQAMWWEDKGYPIGRFRGREIGSYLAMPWAETSLANFLDGGVRGVVRATLSAEHRDGNRPLIEPRRRQSSSISPMRVVGFTATNILTGGL